MVPDETHDYTINLTQGDLFIQLLSDDVDFISKQMQRWIELFSDESFKPIAVPPGLPTVEPMTPAPLTAAPEPSPVPTPTSSPPPSQEATPPEPPSSEPDTQALLLQQIQALQDQVQSLTQQALQAQAQPSVPFVSDTTPPAPSIAELAAPVSVPAPASEPDVPEVFDAALADTFSAQIDTFASPAHMDMAGTFEAFKSTQPEEEVDLPSFVQPVNNSEPVVQNLPEENEPAPETAPDTEALQTVTHSEQPVQNLSQPPATEPPERESSSEEDFDLLLDSLMSDLEDSPASPPAPEPVSVSVDLEISTTVTATLERPEPAATVEAAISDSLETSSEVSLPQFKPASSMPTEDTQSAEASLAPPSPLALELPIEEAPLPIPEPSPELPEPTEATIPQEAPPSSAPAKPALQIDADGMIRGGAPFGSMPTPEASATSAEAPPDTAAEEVDPIEKDLESLFQEDATALTPTGVSAASNEPLYDPPQFDYDFGIPGIPPSRDPSIRRLSLEMLESDETPYTEEESPFPLVEEDDLAVSPGQDSFSDSPTSAFPTGFQSDLADDDEVIEIETFAELCELAPNAKTTQDFLVLAAYFLSNFKYAEKYSLKDMNAELVRSGLTPVNHGILESSVAEGLIELIPDMTGTAKVAEYALTDDGQAHAESLIN